MFIDKGFNEKMAKVAAFALMIRHKEACLPAMKFPQGGIISDVVITDNREFVINPNCTFKATKLNAEPISAPLKDALALIVEKIKADLINQGHK